MLAVGKELGQGPFGSRCQGDQAVAARRQRLERNMRLFLRRSIQMRCRHQTAQIVIAHIILRIERKPVICCWRPLWQIRPRHAQERADDRLNPGFRAGLRERHDAIHAVAIANRRRRKSEFACALGDVLGIDCPFEHRVSREDA